MLIKPSQTQKFCPNCENQFQNGYDVFSYSFPGYKELYTDGHFIDIWGGEEETWIIQCPKCKQYFSVGQFIKRKKSLSENRMFKKFDDEELEIERERYRNLPKIESIHGLQTPAFWDSIIKQGLFYPETATEKEICLLLWHKTF